MYIPTLGRRRLIDVVLASAGLTVLHAGAGWGKTALLRECFTEARGRGLVPVWLGLDRAVAEHHPAFWDELADACTRGLGDLADLPSVAAARAALRGATDARSAGHALVSLFGTVPGLTLFVDALENLTGDAEGVWGALSDVIRTDPGARIAVTTRTLQDAPPQVLNTDVGVALLTERDLGFSDREAADLITSVFPESVILGAPSGGAQVADLSPLPHSRQRTFPSLSSLATHVVSETEGHALSIVTGLRACVHHPDLQAVDWRSVRHLNLRHALEELGVDDLLSATAWLPHFDVPLASELSGLDEDEVAHRLQIVERHGLGRWTPAPHGAWVFAHAPGIREQSTSAYTVQPHLADLAIDWFKDRGAFTDALVLALRTHRLDRATALYRRMLITHPHSFTPEFEAALRDIAPAALHDHPILAVARGVTLLSSSATRDVAVVFLEPVANRDPAALHRETLDEELLELTAQSVVLRLLGRPEDSASVALEASRRISAANGSNSVDPALFTPLACQLSQSLFEAGHVTEAQRLIAHGSAAAPSDQLHFWGLYGRAWYGLDGRLPAAEEMSTLVASATRRPVRDRAGVAWGARTHTLDRVGEAALLLDRWRFDEAADRIVDVRGARWGTSTVWGAWVRLHASLGQGTHASEVVRVQAALEVAPTHPATLGHSALVNVLTIAWLMSGNVVRARRAHVTVSAYAGQAAPAQALLAAACGGPGSALTSLPELRSARGHTVRSRAALETIGATLALRAGAIDLAASLLEEAAAFHSEHACRAHLLYLSETDREAVRGLALSMDSDPVHRYLEGLDSTAPLASSPQHVALTVRELAVLKALAATRSRVAIAAMLHVSENTVKSQLRSVYRKLEVTNRDDAIRRAVELDLLGEGTFRV